VAIHTVNIDALIKREDFEIEDIQQSPSISGGNFKLSELEAGSIILQVLRKPDFQRETKNWTPEKIAELIRGFVDGDLIPAVIMWRSQKSGNIFVVDGAHRLSAFIAWIHNDYGDGANSKSFFEMISPEQIKAADATRELIRRTVGDYQTLKQIAQNQSAFTGDQVIRAKNAGFLPIEVQWVKGDASKAEASFFTINQSATEIHPTELRIIKARKKPNAIAARAIMRAGTGHRYWSDFSSETQKEIESIAREIYDMLFDPSLQSPIKTLDLPVAGRGYSADSLSLVVEFINVANRIKTEMWLGESTKRKRRNMKVKERLDMLPDDEDGSVTISYLKTVQKIASRISGVAPRSLGLHPAVYFYSATGRYQPSAFLAMVGLIQEMDVTNKFIEFTEKRQRFEDFLVKYKHFINQIVKTYGSGTRSLEPITTMYRLILKGVGESKTDLEIATELQADEKLKFLKPTGSEEQMQPGDDFSSHAKSAAFLTKAMTDALRCDICGARVHVKAITFDHKIRKQDGGTGHSDNAQITHPFCNSGFKESKHARSLTLSTSSA